jgi:predicted Zn-dependent protease
MGRFLLAGIVVMLALLARDWTYRARSRAVPSPVVQVVASTTPANSPAPPPVRNLPNGAGTPTIDLLARLEARRQVLRAAPYTYFDSLFAETDSVLRRWPESINPLLIAVPPEASRQDPRLIAVVREAAGVWENAGFRMRFVVTSDTTRAQVRVYSTDQYSDGKVGETRLEWQSGGAIQSAVVTLARNDSAGRPLSSETATAAAVHEFGHALGLAHSGRAGDVMSPIARNTRLSSRDLATITLLYRLPLGTVREVAPR